MRKRRISRSPFLFWLAAFVLAALTAMLVSRLSAEAGDLARRYGPLRPVLVASREVPAGAVVEDADLAVRELPASFLAQGVMSEPAQAAGRTALSRLEPGQTILAGHLAPDGIQGISALLPAGTRAVAVPHGGATPPVEVGDVVDVLVTLDSALTGGGDPTFPVAVAAPVLAAGENLATVAVDPDAAVTIAFAVVHGSVTLAVSSPVAAMR